MYTLLFTHYFTYVFYYNIRSEELTAGDTAHNTKVVSTTSVVDVERSFSGYKTTLADNL